MIEAETATAADTFMPRVSPAAARALAEDFARRTREHLGSRVRQVWLYGSAARGDWTPESDIDVLVILDREEPDDVDWLVKTAYRIGLQDNRLLLQPVMLTEGQFRRLADRERRFAKDVLREGVAL